MEILRATLAHLDELTQLFEQYRIFYQAPSEPQAARDFLQQRLIQQDSVIFLGLLGDRIAGFTQLYPSFSSVSLGPIWILNDLFVLTSYRRSGVATQLMARAETFARDSGALKVGLSTQSSNHIAQALYEARGYVKDNELWHYSMTF